jgi:ABC-type lipoprotein release transport system permease subunit
MLIVLAAFALSGGDGDLIKAEFSLPQLLLLAGYVVFMLAVCMLACIVPTWRALRVEPSEALRAE